MFMAFYSFILLTSAFRVSFSRSTSLVGKSDRKQPIFPRCDECCHKEVHVAKGPTHEKMCP